MAQSEDSKFYIPNLPLQLMTLLAQATEKRAGDMYQDSGCNRCVAGPFAHEQMHQFLAPYGIIPVKLHKQEEFIFGNNQVEMSNCAFQYPVFFDGKLVGSIDIVRSPVPCPALYSKRMIKLWEHVLDFDKQITKIGSFGLTYPFKDSVPMLDIFQMPDRLSKADIPPCFRRDSHDVRLTSTEGIQGQTQTTSTEDIAVSTDE